MTQRRLLLRIAGIPVAWLLRALPRRHRFRAMVLSSRFITPIVPLLPMYRNRGYDLDTPREEALRLVIRAAARSVVEYDPPLQACGMVCVNEAVAQHGCALVLSAHFSLNHLLLRALHDSGHTVATMRGQALTPAVIAGTSIPFHDIALSPTVLVRIRNALRRGVVLVMDVDRPDRREGSLPVETRSGTIHIMPTIFEFALKTRTPVIFAATRAHGPVIRTTFARPVATRVEDVIDEFSAFIREQARLAGPRPFSESRAATPVE